MAKAKNGRAPVDRVERWPLSRIVPYIKNPRMHSPEQVEQIATSMKAFGQAQLIVVDPAGEIIVGHGRVLAAQSLGWPDMVVGIASGWSEEQKRAYRIADNQIGLTSKWDEELLRAEVASLGAFDLNTLAFTGRELERLLAGDYDESLDIAPPPPVKAVSKIGDLWSLGGHMLLCGDVRSADDVSRLMAGSVARMCFTDPPYNVDYSNSAKEIMRGTERPILNDNIGADFGELILRSCTEILRVTSGGIYICMGTAELDRLLVSFKKAGGKCSTLIIWAKSTFTMGQADYQRQFEHILYGWRDGSKRFWCGDRNQGDVWNFDRPRANDLHPTMKPVDLVERAIRNSSDVNDIVIDPFGGSGTTMIAAERTKRRCRMMELDARYSDVIITRWQELTQQQALLDGKTFEQVRRSRSTRGKTRKAAKVAALPVA